MYSQPLGGRCTNSFFRSSLTDGDGRIDSEGEVLESEPLRRLALTWRVVWLKEFVPEGKVQFEIEPLGNLVRLTVSEFHHRNLDEKFKEGGRKGWPIILSGLKTLLETGQPLPTFEMPDAPPK